MNCVFFCWTLIFREVSRNVGKGKSLFEPVGQLLPTAPVSRVIRQNSEFNSQRGSDSLLICSFRKRIVGMLSGPQLKGEQGLRWSESWSVGELFAFLFELPEIWQKNAKHAVLWPQSLDHRLFIGHSTFTVFSFIPDCMWEERKVWKSQSLLLLTAIVHLFYNFPFSFSVNPQQRHAWSLHL